jgi:hypothetical protein
MAKFAMIGVMVASAAGALFGQNNSSVQSDLLGLLTAAGALRLRVTLNPEASRPRAVREERRGELIKEGLEVWDAAKHPKEDSEDVSAATERILAQSEKSPTEKSLLRKVLSSTSLRFAGSEDNADKLFGAEKVQLYVQFCRLDIRVGYHSEFAMCDQMDATNCVVFSFSPDDKRVVAKSDNSLVTGTGKLKTETDSADGGSDDNDHIDREAEPETDEVKGGQVAISYWPHATCQPVQGNRVVRYQVGSAMNIGDALILLCGQYQGAYCDPEKLAGVHLPWQKQEITRPEKLREYAAKEDSLFHMFANQPLNGKPIRQNYDFFSTNCNWYTRTVLTMAAFARLHQAGIQQAVMHFSDRNEEIKAKYRDLTPEYRLRKWTQGPETNLTKQTAEKQVQLLADAGWILSKTSQNLLKGAVDELNKPWLSKVVDTVLSRAIPDVNQFEGI